jgi:hypothetical protein
VCIHNHTIHISPRLGVADGNGWAGAGKVHQQLHCTYGKIAMEAGLRHWLECLAGLNFTTVCRSVQFDTDNHFCG